MRKDANLPQLDFGDSLIATKSLWSQHVYIAKMCNKIDKNGTNVPKIAKKSQIGIKFHKCMKISQCEG